MKRLVLLLALLAMPAFAQQQTLEQRIGARIGTLVIQNEALSEQIEQVKAQLAAAEAKVKSCGESKK